MTLQMQFPENTYLSAVSASMFQSLSDIYASGPEAELEATYARIISLQAVVGGWMEVRSGPGQVYFYDGATGSSTWDANSSHFSLIAELDTALRLIEGPLARDLSNTTLSSEACTAFLNLMRSHGGDVRVIARVMRIVGAQV